MTYELVKNAKNRSEFAIDWDTIHSLLYSYHLSKNQIKYSEIVKESDRSTFNPLTWGLPDVYSLNVQWEQVRSKSKIDAAGDFWSYINKASNDARWIGRDLESKVNSTATNKQTFRERMKNAQQSTMTEVEKAVHDYDVAVDVARFFRDTSADIVVAGSAVLTGGASVAALTAGSVGKGVYKYQDTGNAGEATLKGVGTFVLGAFKVDGNKLSKAGDVALIVAKGVMESTTAYVGGATFGKSVEKGAIKIASSGGSYALFNTALVGRALEKVSIPVNLQIITPDGILSLTEIPGAAAKNALTKSVTKKLAEKGIAATMKAGVGAISSQPATSDSSGASGHVVTEVPFESKALLYLSIVNMDKGVGHGW